MTTPAAHSLHLVSLLAAGLFVAATPVWPAALGALQVRSALGERLDAVVMVTTSPDETLTDRCFHLQAPQNDDSTSVHGATLAFTMTGEGMGQLHIQSAEPLLEPVLKLPLQIKCATDDNNNDFAREYTLLLDPRETTALAPQADLSAAEPTRPAPVQRKLPPAGGQWTVQTGDSIESIASSYYPKAGPARRRFIEQMYALNPSLPQGYRVPLNEDTQIALPKPPATLATKSATAAQKGKHPILRLDESPPATVAPAATTASSAAQMASQVAGQDQQLALLKMQITQLQQELVTVRLQAQAQASRPQTRPVPLTPHIATTKPIPPAQASWDWLLLPLATLFILIPAVYAWWRWKKRQQGVRLAQERFASSVLAADLQTNAVTATPPAMASHSVSQHAAHSPHDWQSASMDVVQPGNVAEEAQLLLDHGLLQQAINLLVQEIEQFPGVSMLWLKLFAIYGQHRMKTEFYERAAEFPHHFQDDSLWHQVQTMGRAIDPENPLYS